MPLGVTRGDDSEQLKQNRTLAARRLREAADWLESGNCQFLQYSESIHPHVSEAGLRIPYSESAHCSIEVRWDGTPVPVTEETVKLDA